MKTEEHKKHVNEHYVYKMKYVFESMMSTADLSVADEDKIREDSVKIIEDEILYEAEKIKEARAGMV